MNSQRVAVTYASSPAFLTTDHWKQILAALLCQFPLRTLHWKSASRPNIQTIQQLGVKLIPLEASRGEHTSQVPQTILDKPLLNIYLVVCEDNDTYKNTVKKQIKDWHALVSQRKNQEWLIVHIVRPDEKTGQGRMFQMKASVLDKIKADFNVDKKDRCVQVVWSTDYENPAAWAELINKLKEGILSAFDTAFIQREEEVRRSEGQRHMPGWNFCTFFILKESLALSLEGMSLSEDALQQYDELEASFFQVLQEKNLSWFGALISPGPQDDSAPLLAITRKPYRELILANSISVFDFRIYLLARQCVLLSRLGRVIEICRKVASFLSSFGRRLREVEDILPRFFVESWTYSSVFSVVEYVDACTNSAELGKSALAKFNACKGELMELALQQFDIIGIRVGHLPARPPFSIALPTSYVVSDTSQRERPQQTISRADLLATIEDKESFFDTYVQIINRAIELYASAGRRKFALKLHSYLAALDLIRDRSSSAFETYKSLPAHYSPHGWTSLESLMRIHALTVHASAGMEKDTDWIHIVLEFLKTFVEDMGKDLLMDTEAQVSYLSELISDLREAARNTSSDVLYPDHPGFSVRIAGNDARLAQSQDGALLDVIVHNHIPCEFMMDEVVAVLVGSEGAQLSFSGKVEKLVPGANKFTLFCPSSTAGVFALHTSQLRVSRLIFDWKDQKLVSASKNSKSTSKPTLVRFPKDLRALDVKIRPSQLIEVGAPAKILVVVQSGRNDVLSATIRLTAPSGVQFTFSEARVDREGSAKLETTDDGIILIDMAKDQTTIISLPHSDASSYHILRVNVSLDYTTASQPTLSRKLSFARYVATSLPVTVNVEDFFRGTRLFTRFTLSTTSHQHVRIESTHLEASQRDADIVQITECTTQKPTVTTITPSQSGRFMFQLDCTRGQARDPLKLKIRYRMLREEVESLIGHSIDMVVAELPELRQYRDLFIDKVVEVLSLDAKWIELYGVTGELIVPSLPAEGDEVRRGLHRLKEVLALQKWTDLTFGEWREIIIPLDVPRMQILAAARLHILVDPVSAEPTVPLFAGQAISAMVTVTTSFHWAPAEDVDDESYPLRYDIEDMTGDWLVSGYKKGDFLAEDGTTFSTPVTLIALHHGELSLPKVGITARPMHGETRTGSSLVPSCETYQMHGAETVLVLPRGGRSTFVVDMGREPRTI